MWSSFFSGWLVVLLVLPGPGWAVEAAPALTDRETAERLTRLEEGQSAIRAEMGHLRADLDKQVGLLREEMGQLRADMHRQNQQLRDDINAQFDRLFQLLLGLLGTFTALVIATISFALWDRRTMLRPVEGRVTSLEEEMAGNRPRTAALLDSLRTLSQRDPELAAVLKTFNL